MEVPGSLFRSSSYNTVLSSGTPTSASYSTSSTSTSASKMMKIAIAGTNGFAQLVAHYIESTTPYQFMLLSNRENRELVQKKNWQIVRTGYVADPDLDYLLEGVNVVISTIAGAEQIALINAAASAGVDRFVPSEFGASPWTRTNDDSTDNRRRMALARLEELEAQCRLKYTVFSCGLFYERFGPGGLAHWHINIDQSLGGEGTLLVDVRMRTATIPVTHSLPIQVSMISASDAARYVVAALTLQDWPRELSFRAEQLDLVTLVDVCQRVRGGAFQWLACDMATLIAGLTTAQATQSITEQVYYSQTLAVARGEFDMPMTNLDTMINVECEPFATWLTRVWAGIT